MTRRSKQVKNAGVCAAKKKGPRSPEEQAQVEKLRAIVAERGIKGPELARRMGTSHEQIYRLLQVDQSKEWRSLNRDWIGRFAKELHFNPSILLTDTDDPPKTVPLVGYIGAGGMYYPDARSGPWVGFLEVESPPWVGDGLFALRVVGNALEPVYSDGDTLYCERAPLGDLIGKKCVIQLAGGNAYVRTVRKAEPVELAWPGAETMRGVTVEWAARIAWARPA